MSGTRVPGRRHDAVAIRIVSLEHQLAAAHQRIAHLEQTTGEPRSDPSERCDDCYDYGK